MATRTRGEPSAVVELDGVVLAQVHHWPLRVDPVLLGGVRRELIDRRGAGANDGWLLGIDLPEQPRGSAARALDEQVRKGLGHHLPPAASFSFLKVSSARPRERSGIHATTFHVDTHEAAAQEELFRVLINLAPTPRRVLIGDVLRPGLEAAGLVRPGDFHVVGLPAECVVRTVELDGYDGATVTALCFWPSLLPHVGCNDDPDGYFVLSYEMSSPSPLSCR